MYFQIITSTPVKVQVMTKKALLEVPYLKTCFYVLAKADTVGLWKIDTCVMDSGSGTDTSLGGCH